jgi:hypothetical protein
MNKMETIQVLRLIKNIFLMIFAFLKNQSSLAIENLALRQQLSIYHHSKKRPKIRLQDRLFWIVISRCWEQWKDTLIFVKPETVINWLAPERIQAFLELKISQKTIWETRNTNWGHETYPRNGQRTPDFKKLEYFIHLLGACFKIGRFRN